MENKHPWFFKNTDHLIIQDHHLIKSQRINRLNNKFPIAENEAISSS